MPDIVSHLLSVDFVNTHQGIEKRMPAPSTPAPMGTYTNNDDENVDWTGDEGLGDALYNRGVKVFFSL